MVVSGIVSSTESGLFTALLPPDSSENFNDSLAVTMNALQDLRSNLSTDVFISYCEANVPSDEDLDNCVHPRTVKDDLKKAGLKWSVE